jgi:hypothetical protein
VRSEDARYPFEIPNTPRHYVVSPAKATFRLSF